MFEELEAKRICRADLRSRSSSPSSEPDEEIQSLLQSRLTQLYGPIATISAISDIQIEGETNLDTHLQEDVEGNGFEFRLFATSTGSEAASGSKAGRVILGNDAEPHDGKGGFVVPWRDPRYHFTGEITVLQKRQFELAAVSGEDVQRGLKIRHRGLEVPWRVSVIKLAVSNKDAGVGAEEKTTGAVEGKRKRMGKKMRILHRKREKIRKELQISEQEKLALKEAADREKKTKRNREKQQKKRAKEKAKKASNVGEAASSSASARGDSVMGEG